MTLPNRVGPDRPPDLKNGSVGVAPARHGVDTVTVEAVDPFAYLTIGLACLTVALAAGTTASLALSFRLNEPILLTNYGIVALGLVVRRYAGRRN